MTRLARFFLLPISKLTRRKWLVILSVVLSAVTLAIGMANLLLPPPSAEIFSELNIMGQAKHTPLESDVERCLKHRDASEECAILTRAMRAYDDLFAFGRTHAFKMTLSSLETACRSLMEAPDQHESQWMECFGATKAIVFFASPDEDQMMLRFFETRTGLLYWILQHNSYAWVANRTYYEQWGDLYERLRKSGSTSALMNPFTREARTYPMDVLTKAIARRDSRRRYLDW